MPVRFLSLRGCVLVFFAGQQACVGARDDDRIASDAMMQAMAPAERRANTDAGALAPTGADAEHRGDAPPDAGTAQAERERNAPGIEDAQVPPSAPPGESDDRSSVMDPAPPADQACETPSAEDAERLLRGQFAPPDDAKAAAPGTIAYLRYDNSLYQRTEIRLVQEDGTGDRLLYKVSENVGIWYRPWDLAWRPDGRELAFTSGHLDSFFVRDIYAITVDGANLRRITNPPLPEALAAYPRGAVTFVSQPLESASAEYSLYLQGMDRAVTWLDPGIYDQRKIRASVADFGARKQRAVLRKLTEPIGASPYCAYNEPGALVDVLACGEVEVASRLPSLSWSLSSTPCLYADRPLWTRGANDMFYVVPWTGFKANYQLIRTKTELSEPGSQGTLVNPVQPYLAVPAEPYDFVSLNPADDEHLLMTFSQTGLNQQIYRVSTSDPRSTADITVPACGDLTIGGRLCNLGGLAHRKDGSGFYYIARAAGCDTSAGDTCWSLRDYDFESGALSTLATFSHASIRGLSVSPDEKRFMLGVPKGSGSVRDLWLYDHATGQERLFLAGATYAVWAP